MIQTGPFADGVLEYYQVAENDLIQQRVPSHYSTLVHSGHKTGEGGMGGDLCAYHAD